MEHAAAPRIGGRPGDVPFSALAAAVPGLAAPSDDDEPRDAVAVEAPKPRRKRASTIPAAAEAEAPAEGEQAASGAPDIPAETGKPRRGRKSAAAAAGSIAPAEGAAAAGAALAVEDAAPKPGRPRKPRAASAAPAEDPGAPEGQAAAEAVPPKPRRSRKKAAPPPAEVRGEEAAPGPLAAAAQADGEPASPPAEAGTAKEHAAVALNPAPQPAPALPIEPSAARLPGALSALYGPEGEPPSARWRGARFSLFYPLVLVTVAAMVGIALEPALSRAEAWSRSAAPVPAAGLVEAAKPRAAHPTLFLDAVEAERP